LTRVLRSQYYAVGINKLPGLMEPAEFQDVQRLDDRTCQPVLLGRSK
jgi:hypothetical protein